MSSCPCWRTGYRCCSTASFAATGMTTGTRVAEVLLCHGSQVLRYLPHRLLDRPNASIQVRGSTRTPLHRDSSLEGRRTIRNVNPDDGLVVAHVTQDPGIVVGAHRGEKLFERLYRYLQRRIATVQSHQAMCRSKVIRPECVDVESVSAVESFSLFVYERPIDDAHLPGRARRIAPLLAHQCSLPEP